jgi:hypothetical protein
VAADCRPFFSFLFLAHAAISTKNKNELKKHNRPSQLRRVRAHDDGQVNLLPCVGPAAAASLSPLLFVGLGFSHNFLSSVDVFCLGLNPLPPSLSGGSRMIKRTHHCKFCAVFLIFWGAEAAAGSRSGGEEDGGRQERRRVRPPTRESAPLRFFSPLALALASAHTTTSHSRARRPRHLFALAAIPSLPQQKKKKKKKREGGQPQRSTSPSPLSLSSYAATKGP